MQILMETFEIMVNDQAYKVIRDDDQRELFSVFNHSTFHIIKKNDFGGWETVEHRFGWHGLQITGAGNEIDKYYDYLAFGCISKST